MQKEEFEYRFFQYADQFDENDEKIKLKKVHTRNVAQLAGSLAENEHLNERQQLLVQAAAWFHDLGRFEQAARYHTFLDKDSLDHAALSARLLKEGRFLDGLSDQEKEDVICAVSIHSLLKIPEDLSAQASLLSKILRDADKLDIFRVYAFENRSAVVNGSVQNMSSMQMTPAVYESLMRHEPVRKEDRKNALDIWMTFLGFFFDFNFTWSLKTAAGQGYWRLPLTQISFTEKQTALQLENVVREIENLLTESV